MALNFLLRDRFQVGPDDPMGRTWAGWDAYATDDDLWAVNRGLWSLGAAAEYERFATLSYRGIIQVVAEITGRKSYELVGGMKWAMTGDVLRPGDPVRDELVGTAAPRNRNPVSYVPTRHVDTLAAAERAVPNDREPVTMLATWNPANWQWRDHIEQTQAVASGRILRDTWSTGSRRSGIKPGDRVFLLLQGVGDRGIIGSGTCASRIFQGDHWDPDRPDDEANYVIVEWDTLLPTEQALPRTQLMHQIPAGQWTPQGSGTLLPADTARHLEQLWARHLGHEKPRPRRNSPRQRWQMDPIRRKKVEDAAQQRLTRHYEALGWAAEDTRFGNPYDATATKDGQILYLEAKGTETAGSSVIVSTPVMVRRMACRRCCAAPAGMRTSCVTMSATMWWNISATRPGC